VVGSEPPPGGRWNEDISSLVDDFLKEILLSVLIVKRVVPVKLSYS